MCTWVTVHTAAVAGLHPIDSLRYAPWHGSGFSYDRFLTEQLAGDEMDDWRSAPAWTAPMREHLIATGFLRTAMDNTTEQELNRPFERYQVLRSAGGIARLSLD